MGRCIISATARWSRCDNGDRSGDRLAGGVRAGPVQIALGTLLPDIAPSAFHVSSDRHCRSGVAASNFLDWLNSYHAIVTAYISLTLPFALWVLTTFSRSCVDIEEVAWSTAARRWQALRLVIFRWRRRYFLPPQLSFSSAWKEFFFALIILTYPGTANAAGRYRTLPR